jgi:hypothetical protein
MSSFFPETMAKGNELSWQVLFVEKLISIHPSERDFRSAD